MSMETIEPENPLFERYVQRTMPDHLRGQPVAGSVGIADDLEEHRRAARRRWNEALAAGFTEAELASDERLEISQGRPVRPLAGTLTASMVARARQAKADVAARRGAGLDDLTRSRLDEAASGSWSSADSTAEGIVSQAEAAVRGFDARQAAAAREQDSKIRIEVRAICGPASCYAGDLQNIREYALTSEQLEALEKWTEIMWVNRRGQPYPEGYNASTWPPWRRVVQAVAT